MRLLADESVDRPVTVRLRADGHEVASIAEDSPGVNDREVLARAVRANALLITADKDFGELVYRDRRPHCGVLLPRLSGLDEATKCDMVSWALRLRGGELEAAFSVLTEESLRIRRQPDTPE